MRDLATNIRLKSIHCPRPPISAGEHENGDRGADDGGGEELRSNRADFQEPVEDQHAEDRRDDKGRVFFRKGKNGQAKGVGSEPAEVCAAAGDFPRRARPQRWPRKRNNRRSTRAVKGRPATVR